jgi:hypothetical protein
MSKDKDKQQSWWQTLPGVMTALGAIITALTGLLIALNQAGLIGVQQQPTPSRNNKQAAISAATEAPNAPPTFTREIATKPTKTPLPPVAEAPPTDTPVTLDAPNTGPTAAAVVAPAATPPPPPSNGAEQYPITLPAGAEATAGKVTYRVMAAQIERPSMDKLALRLTMRALNTGLTAINYWGDSARLITDDVPEAPSDAPNLVVDAQAAIQGEFLFDLPNNVSAVILQVGQVGQETSRIPIDLTAAQPPPTATAPPGGALQYPANLQAGAEATAGKVTYRVMAAQITGPKGDGQVLSITMRAFNKGLGAINYWGDSARLIIADVPEAPFDSPNLVVDAQAAKQGEFLFEIPYNLPAVILQVGQVGQETARISIDLTAP